MASVTLRQVLARRLRVEIVRRERTVVVLAGLADVSAAHVYDVLAAKKAATVDFIEKVAEALEIEPWQLLRQGAEDAPAAKKKSRVRSSRSVRSGRP